MSRTVVTLMPLGKGACVPSPSLSLDLFRGLRSDFRTGEYGYSLYHAAKRHVRRTKDVNLEVSLIK